MRKLTLLLLTLALAALPLCAQPAVTPPGAVGAGPWDAMITTGFVVDLTGYALFVAGGTVTSIDFGVGLALFGVGSVGMTAGAVIWNLALDRKDAAYREQGIVIDPDKRSRSWNLVWWTVGCETGAIIVGFTVPGLGGWIGTLALAGGAAIIETVNWFGPRTEWTKSLNEGYAAKQASLSAPAVVPVVATVVLPGGRSVGTYVGARISL